MIKVCYIIGQLSRGGAEKQLFELVRNIDRTLFKPTVISLSRGGHWSGQIRKHQVRVIELAGTDRGKLDRLVDVVRILKKLRPHIVHTYLLAANTYGRLAAIAARTPVIIASERNLPEIGKDKRPLDICVDKCLAAFSDAVICNSSRAADQLTGRYFFNRRKVFTVHNGINMTEFPKRALPSVKRLRPAIIGTIGRLYPQKNHKLFLDMARLVLQRCPGDIRFLVVGDGPLRSDLCEYARALGIDRHVEFAGERSDVPSILQELSVFVSTSLYEGLSNSIMEAMLSGLPVVATDVGGTSELVVNGETGFLCPSNDAGALANAVLTLLEDEGRMIQMGDNGGKRMSGEFSVEKMALETQRIYHGLLEKKAILKRSAGDIKPYPVQYIKSR